jgi:probable F420-dependent oxidoreductase
MRFIVVMPFDKVEPAEEFLTLEAVSEMAQCLETAGFHGCSVTDHPCPTGRWLDAGGHHAQDPFVMLALLASATTKLMLQTGILVLPYRNPFLTIRAVNTLDVLSGGRVLLGLGAGYLKGEYKALGADFDNRNDVMDEYLRAMKAAWSGEEFTFGGHGYEALGNRILPLPSQKPHPPLWIGGNSKRAMRRAVEFGDAWCPFHTTAGRVSSTARTAPMEGLHDIAEAIDYMRDHAEKIGKTMPGDLVLDSMKSPTEEWNPQALIDQSGKLHELGITWVSVHIPGRDRIEWCDNVERYGSEVVSQIS